MEYETIERLCAASGPIVPEAFGGSTECAVAKESEWAQQWQRGDDHVITTALDYSRLEGVTPARLANGTAIPPKALARLACNSLLSRVIFGPESTVLNSGREERIFTAGQTRAIIARDGTCRYPGCDEGPGFGEIHHSISWAKHRGNTDVDLGILLCYHHHDLVHQRNITITRRAGTWVFTDEQGAQIQLPGHALPPDPQSAHPFSSEPPPF